jgi:hypothetical protein
MWPYLQMWFPFFSVTLGASICCSVAAFVMSHEKPHPELSRPGWRRRRPEGGSPGPRPPDSGRGFSFRSSLSWRLAN